MSKKKPSTPAPESPPERPTEDAEASIPDRLAAVEEAIRRFDEASKSRLVAVYFRPPSPDEDEPWTAGQSLGIAQAVRTALWCLREELEHGRASWEAPFVEVRFPVWWDWENERAVFDLPVSAEVGLWYYPREGPPARLPGAPPAPAGREKKWDPQAALFHAYREHHVLSALVGRVAAVETPPSAGEVLDSLPRLFSFFNDSLMVVESAEPDHAEADVVFRFRGPNGGGGVRLAVQDLVVDTNARLAFFPVKVGLSSLPPVSSWTSEDRSALWDALFGELERVSSYYTRLLLDENETPPASPELAVKPGTEPPVTERIFPLAFGLVPGDDVALGMLRQVHRLRLFGKKLPPTWKEQSAKEIERIQEEEGEDAFVDLRPKGGRPPLLKKTFRGEDAEETVRLTSEGESRLRIRLGLGSGFRHVDKKTGKEYLVRSFQVRSGFLEVGFSWFDLAGPWVKEWRKELKEQDLQRKLWETVPPDQQNQITRRLPRAGVLEDARRIMEVVCGQVGKQGQRPVLVPARTLRVLFGLEADQNWKDRVEEAIRALRVCEFRVVSLYMQDLYGEGPFLADWWYVGAGPGDHSEGWYVFDVRPGFLGCLRIFEAGKRELVPEKDLFFQNGKNLTLYDFTKRPTAEDRKTLGWGHDRKRDGKTWVFEKRETKAWITHFDAGQVFYNAAEGLTPEQEGLVDFLYRNTTLKSDGVSKSLGDYQERKAAQVKKPAEGYLEPRLYSTKECPLLPEGKLYCGALGHKFEGGRTLAGVPRRAGRTGGLHRGGLLYEMGHLFPAGRNFEARERVISRALADIKAVVVDYLQGVVAVKVKGSGWRSLAEAAQGELPERELLERAAFYFFIPETWRVDMVKKFEVRMAERARRLGTPAWKVTEDPKVAQESARRLARGESDALTQGTPLHERLRSKRTQASLSQSGAALLFRVSQVAYSKWERGRIPSDRRSHVEKWVETGTPPTPEELAAVHPKRVLKGGRPPRVKTPRSGKRAR